MNYIFGIFDVLGFTSFCENCDSRSAEGVLKIMDEFETTLPEAFFHALDESGKVSQDKKESVTRRLTWLTFSDTIFVAIPFDQSVPSNTQSFNMVFFVALVILINRRMFELGLPLRGSVHIGEAVVSKRCFAGKAIVDAFNRSKDCQVAATVVSDEAHVFMLKVLANTKLSYMVSDSIVECDIPTRTKKVSQSIFGYTTKKMKTLNWFGLEFGKERFAIPSDLSLFVRERFTAHGKRLSGEKEIMKAVNTENLFRYWQCALALCGRQLLSILPPNS